ncbi:MAG: hypothetical protein CVU09_04910 [Bacteroidetes bacterium HGW-Bacteroidetes-4]|jgi:GNAT superfamily N-acetyltransferase|nr:MAG: hypothetical protein CVU09_04910 [Bacteroidetes bacterium HGW-Bacteroidetes-4]
MEYQIKKIRLGELEAYANSSEYKESDVIPISSNRIKSYVNNPRADKNDVVLYLLFDGSKLIAFRTLFADYLILDGQKIKFAWLSGSWVRTEYRRMGIATQLLDELFADWEGSIIFTNYAPNSKALYDKSKKFEPLIEKQGVRYYFRFHNAALLKKRNVVFERLHFAFKLFDLSMNLLFLGYYFIQKKRFKNWPNEVECNNENISDEVLNYMAANPASNFKRGETEIRWILNHPWVTQTNNDLQLYPFSSYATCFYYKTLLIRSPHGYISGLALLKVRNRAVTIPYYHAAYDSNTTLGRAIVVFCHKINANSFTLYQTSLVETIEKIMGVALFKKDMTQKYFIANKLKNRWAIGNKQINVQDGDGDCIFT